MPTAYDEVEYPTSAEARLHLENLYLCAYLNGYSPAPVDRARVLEIGCGTGFNLAPMAAEFPESRFVGIDYAETAIRTGNELLRPLGMGNLELRCADLVSLEESLGEFDYVIAHGFYSWVPDAVREAMWRVASRSLSLHGIFHVSYNALPGWYPACGVQDFARFLAGPEGAMASQVDRVWDSMGVFARYAESGHPFAVEAARIRKNPKQVLFHDELGAESRPFYLSDVVSRAKREGLHYVAEADLRVPADLRQNPDVAQMIVNLSSDDMMLRRQLLDFTAMRRFHDSLFTREGHAQVRRSLSDSLLACWARSDVRFVESKEGGARVYEHSGGVRLTSKHAALCHLLDAVQAAVPGSVSLGAIFDQIRTRNASEVNEQRASFARMALQLLEDGALRIRQRQVPVATAVASYPLVLPFTRLQVTVTPRVPNVYNESSEVPEGWQRALMHLLDGTRDLDALTESLAALSSNEFQAARGKGERGTAPFFGIADCTTFRENPSIIESFGDLAQFYREQIPIALAAFCRAGYLV